MNCYERKSFNRKSQSLQNWKDKAKSRRYELKKLQSRVKEITKSRDMWKEECKKAQDECKKVQDELKKNLSTSNRTSGARKLMNSKFNIL